ncbi:tetratricopeptide repeat protein [Streptococcus constellatus]|uniref:tetratricopeptide repeat protein n=1 Tax=Streptococcus constellatus TaxID=76860 RepID=UPI0020017311|nr:tetratricopeptide repeat protein [Streptococcus constellatus]
MTEEQLQKAWQALFDGQYHLAKQLVYQIEQDNYSTLNLKAYIALEEKDFALARQFLKDYYAQAVSEKNLEEQHIGLHQLAMVEREEEHFQKAYDLIMTEAAIIIEHFPGDVLKKSVNLYEQGYLQFKLGNIHLAEELLQETLNLALQTDDLVNHACAYRALAEVMLAKRDIKRAKLHVQKALACFEKAGDGVGATELKGLMAQIK